MPANPSLRRPPKSGRIPPALFALSMVCVLCAGFAPTRLRSAPLSGQEVDDQLMATLNLFDEGRYGETASKLESLLARHGKSLPPHRKAEAAFFIARSKIKLERKKEAILWLGRMAEYDPTDDRATDCLESLGVRTGPDPGMVKLRDDLFRALERLHAVIRFRQEHAGAADTVSKALIPVFRRALEKGVEPGKAHYGLGTCLTYQAKSAREAGRHLRKAIKLDPDNPQPYLSAARYFDRRGDSKAKIRTLTEARKRGHRDRETTTILTAALVRRARPADASLYLALLEEVATADPASGSTIVKLIRDPSLRRKAQAIVLAAKTESLKQEGILKQATIGDRPFGRRLGSRSRLSRSRLRRSRIKSRRLRRNRSRRTHVRTRKIRRKSYRRTPFKFHKFKPLRPRLKNGSLTFEADDSPDETMYRVGQ